jgi:Tfp pilus assembly protein PilF
VFCSAAFQRFAACLPALLLLGSCSHRAAPGIQRLAVLRLENLGSDSASDWMGRSLSEIIIAGLAADPQTYAIPSLRLHNLGPALGVRPVAVPGISTEASLAMAAGASRLAYGDYYVAGGVLHARLAIEDPRTHRILRVLQPVTAPASDPAAAGNALVRQIWPQAPPYPVRNPAALEAYAESIEAPDAEGIERCARQAIAADPDFGAPYLVLAELHAQRQDRAGVAAILQSAAARGPALGQADRARLEVIAAGAAGNVPARERALAAVVRLSPNDPAAWRGLAEIAEARRQPAQALQAYQRALAIEPEDVNSWNQLAYSAAAAGNLATAMAALRRYQTLRPSDPNSLDSMGDVNVMVGHFKEGEQFYLAAIKMSPGFYEGADFYKAAMARLMTGDVAGADALFNQYPAAARHRTEWLWVSGRRRQAYQALMAEAPAMAGDVQARAYAELAIWSMFLEDRSAAARFARQAGAGAGQASAPLAALSAFLASPPLPAEAWTARATQFFPNGPDGTSRAQDMALAYGLLFDGKFPAAAAVLRRIYSASAAPDNSTAIELGWALLETGNLDEAAPLLRLYPLPGVNGPSPLTGLYFPRIFSLRARLAEKQGKPDEARANQRIFEALSPQ